MAFTKGPKGPRKPGPGGPRKGKPTDTSKPPRRGPVKSGGRFARDDRQGRQDSRYGGGQRQDSRDSRDNRQGGQGRQDSRYGGDRRQDSRDSRDNRYDRQGGQGRQDSRYGGARRQDSRDSRDNRQGGQGRQDSRYGGDRRQDSRDSRDNRYGGQRGQRRQGSHDSRGSRHSGQERQDDRRYGDRQEGMAPKPPRKNPDQPYQKAIPVGQKPEQREAPARPARTAEPVKPVRPAVKAYGGKSRPDIKFKDVRKPAGDEVEASPEAEIIVASEEAAEAVSAREIETPEADGGYDDERGGAYEDVIYGIHAVEALLDQSPDRINRIHFLRGAKGRAISAMVGRARAAGLPLEFEPRARLDNLTGRATHQGVVAQVTPVAYASLDDLIEKGKSRPPGLILVLDGVSDPGNLGAIIRTAEAAGAHGVVVPKRRAAPLSSTVAKASAGASTHLPLARVVNTVGAVRTLKEAGYWIYGLDSKGDDVVFEADYSQPVAFVLGGEEKGLRPLLARNCDKVLSIPLTGKTPSLNVSVAAAVAVFSAVSTRTKTT